MKTDFKFYVIAAFVSLSYGHIAAQQSFNFSQYMVNPYIFNPAAGGTTGDVDVQASYRRQWVNFPGSPTSTYVTAHAPIKIYKKPNALRKLQPFHSLGCFIYQDVAGPIKKQSALGSYGYNLPLTKNLRLAMAMFGGVVTYQVDYSILVFDQDGEHLAFNKKTMPDFSIGTWLHNDHFYIGASINHLLNGNLNFLNDEGTSSTQEKSNLPYHFYLTGGYNIPLGYRQGRKNVHDYYIVPSIMFKYAGTGTSPALDFNVKFKKTNAFWIGASYRSGDAFALLVGVTALSTERNVLEVSYSYDYPITRIQQFSTGSHEIIVGYKFKRKQKILCPNNFW